MYGDSGAMRRRAAQLREQGEEIRLAADRLVARTEAVPWTGRAADAMRERIHERASHLRDVASRHEAAAESLERHLLEVDALKDDIAARERRAEALVQDAPRDAAVAAFTPPPAGHKDWLTAELPGL
jgi:hypothetical protein